MASRASAAPRDTALPTMARFEVVRALGNGAAGMVFEAIDRASGARVALKTLRAATPDLLLQLKSEFRSIQDLDHPNLIRLDELSRDGDTWFFTMELVHGVPFTTWVTGESAGAASSTLTSDAVSGAFVSSGAVARFDEPRLRDALAQLARGLAALHAAGKVHRDIKPANVLVTFEGRVVVLDLGLARDAASESEQTIVGTVPYMAPEQVTGEAVDPACDCYAVGVILYACLTGRLPFEGAMDEVMIRKIEEDPPPPSALVPDLPPDLDALCMDLLARDPAGRPSAADVVARLTQPQGGAAPVRRAAARGARPFVGREAELRALGAAYEEARAPRTVAVLIDGESGVGKSALVRSFTRALPSFYDDVLVLRGRCHEREALPYKALDGILDQLGEHLGALPDDEADALLPSDAAVLARAFPVFARAGSARPASLGHGAPLGHVAGGRARLFAAVRELFAKVAAHRSVVLVIDDMQWADADSLALLGDLLRPPGAPPMLVLMTQRADAARADDGARPFGLACDVRRTRVARLSPAESAELARALLDGSGADLDATAAAIAAEAAGHPLFLDELARHARLTGGGAQVAVRLDEVLTMRVAQLDPGARHLLETVAVAGIALRTATAIAATAGAPREHAAYVRALRAQHLARTSARDGDELVETYHDRVRDAVLATLAEPARRRCHERVARALEATSPDAADAIATQWLAAGEPARALPYALAAAEQAYSSLAFERAAELFERALPLFERDTDERQRARVRVAESYANAGNGTAAARAFAAAAAHASKEEAVELRRRQADQLLSAGRLDEGEAVMREVLATVGLELPGSSLGALVGFLAARARLWVRGVDFRPRGEAEIPSHARTRLDACAGVSSLLGMVDTMLGLLFQTKTLLYALDAGEPSRIARALAVEGPMLAAPGRRARAKSDAALARAWEIADRVGTPNARGMVLTTRALTAFLCGDFPQALRDSLDAQALLRDAVGAQFELRTSEMVMLWSLTWLGDVAELGRRIDAFVRGADARGDLYGATSMRAGSPGGLAWLVGDDPAWARDLVQSTTRRWSQRGYHNQHYWSMFAESQIDLYEGRGVAVWTRVGEHWPRMKRSFMTQVQIIRNEARFLRARAAIVAAAEQPALARPMLRAVEREASALDRDDAPYTAAMAALLRGSLAAIAGHDDRAVAALRAAIAGFDQVSMRLQAEAARWRLGQLIGGDEGGALVAAAEQWARAQGIVSPTRMLTMVAPGFARSPSARPRLAPASPHARLGA